MDKERIGALAGVVWSVLTDNSKWAFSALKKKACLSDEELGAALGWLAREDKIEFDRTNGELYIYLCLNVYIG